MIALALLLLTLQAPGEAYDRFAAAYATLDAERVSSLYTEDAFYLPPSDDMVRGRDAIRDRYARAFDQSRKQGHTRRITFELMDRVVAGDVRNDIGYFTIITTDPDGHAERFRGKFLKVWRRGADGVWRIQADSYSSAGRF
jgi:uncharacterized protein (TIGR02246 family)